MTLRPGTRLRSQVCTTEIIVVRPGPAGIVIECGGRPMAEATAPVGDLSPGEPSLMTGTLLGKRYTDNASAELEVLVTKAGDGTLSTGPDPLVLKEARPLPASD
jgi:hypothetical protein